MYRENMDNKFEEGCQVTYYTTDWLKWWKKANQNSKERAFDDDMYIDIKDKLVYIMHKYNIFRRIVS